MHCCIVRTELIITIQTYKLNQKEKLNRIFGVKLLYLLINKRVPITDGKPITKVYEKCSMDGDVILDANMVYYNYPRPTIM